MVRLSVVCASLLGFALSGCAAPKFVGRPDLQLVQGDVLPPPSTVDLIAEERPYLIGPLDKLVVDIYGVPELSRSVQVDASGGISLPLVGVVHASGKTPGELSSIIADRLGAHYVRDPRVTVNLTETLSQTVTVDGAVGKPGSFPVAGRMTLMRAIAQAEGVTEFARDNYVVVFRRVNNKEMAALYDLRAIRQGMYADPSIYANDIVYIGESQARRVFKDVISASGLIAAPLVAILN